AHVNASYVWLPLKRIVKLEVEAPSSLRDFVWTKAYLQLDNGGTTAALIPTRYAGTVATGDHALMLGRRTEWQETPGGAYHGLGQRLFATDEHDISLLELRTLNFAHGE
ncbi:MAG: type VI secretion system accessory protein TagJ, partial [Puniceicoccales bacterium]